MESSLSIEELEREIRRLNKTGELNDQELLELRQCLRLCRREATNPAASSANRRSLKTAARRRRRDK